MVMEIELPFYSPWSVVLTLRKSDLSLNLVLMWLKGLSFIPIVKLVLDIEDSLKYIIVILLHYIEAIDRQ